jgi:uncharacterized protein
MNYGSPRDARECCCPDRVRKVGVRGEMANEVLVCDGRRVGEVVVADGPRARMRGLLGRDEVDGALLLRHASAVHTIGMRFAIDVAFLDKRCVVVDVATMAPGRVGRPRMRARSILEAMAGSFGEWGLERGSRIEFEGRG